MKATVLLLNRARRGGDPSQKVSGQGGVFVGDSRYNPKYDCHTIEISLEQYEKVARALSAWNHRPLCNWEAHFIVEQESAPAEIPKAVQEFWDGYKAQMENPDATNDGSECFRTGVQIAWDEQLIAEKERTKKPTEQPRYDAGSAPGSDFSFPPVDETMPFFTLAKIARMEGLNIVGLPDTAARLEAIQKNRERIIAENREQALRGGVSGTSERIGQEESLTMRQLHESGVFEPAALP